MENKVNYVAVGLFVLVLAAVFVVGSIWLAAGGAFQKKYDIYLAFVNESVSGLNLNAPVKYSGVEIGKVREIRLHPGNPNHVQLTLAIERGTPIKVDTIAMLNTQGLTGIAFIELTGGVATSPPLLATGKDEYPVIRTKPSLSTRLENVLTTVLTKLDSTSTSVSAILSIENQAAIKSALADIAAVAHTLETHKDTLDTGIASAARTFDNSARVTAQLEPMIERISRSANAIEKMGNETALASVSARKTVDAVGTDMKHFTAETLPEVHRLLGEISVMTISLRRLSEQAERNPSSFIFGHKPVPTGPGESKK